MAALAQQAELGRASGGEIAVVTKGTARLSGSLGISMTSANDVFGGGEGYDMSAGGTLIQDRLWFFAAGSQQNATSPSQFAGLELPERAVTSAVDAKLNAHIGNAHDFSALYQNAQVPAFTGALPETFIAIVPSNFLSLRYTALISPNAVFSGSISRRSVKID